MTTQPTTDITLVATTSDLTAERAELLEAFAKHRGLLLHTAQGLSDEQARSHPTVSELSVGGVIKHTTAMTAQWLDFVEQGTEAMASFDDVDWAQWADQFVLREDQTLQQVLDGVEEVARRTDEVVRTVDLDRAHALPDAPWFDAGARWTARRVLLHLLTEIAQHAGHADILRESIDGQKSMG
jgi:uncharacterized damage-inducible protein DinB